ncbi:MAG: hypothetical protein LBL01_07835, partial [Bifidobacteriaceae bacterium]|nr:hypothetical protein [Bifidobacteriaceae bacterium]
MADLRLLAVDLGSSTVRVTAGRWDGRRLATAEAYRFEHAAQAGPAGVFWDWGQLWGGVVEGLRKAMADSVPTSLGIDTWGVDYGYVGPDGVLLAPPRSYRDPRGARHVEAAYAALGPGAYAACGIPAVPINTAVQVFADLAEAPRLVEQAERLLLL